LSKLVRAGIFLTPDGGSKAVRDIALRLLDQVFPDYAFNDDIVAVDIDTADIVERIAAVHVAGGDDYEALVFAVGDPDDIDIKAFQEAVDWVDGRVHIALLTQTDEQFRAWLRILEQHTRDNLAVYCIDDRDTEGLVASYERVLGIHARTIGIMTMIDAGKKDHKIIAVATEDPEFNSYREASEMPVHRLTMLRRFFQDYKQLEGKAVEVDEIQPSKEGFPIIEDALARYSRQRRRGFK